MTYVISNPHGCYDQFVTLLEQIRFGKDDAMFVLGDIVDYGSETMNLLCDLTFRENIWPVAGERDRIACRMLSGFDKMLRDGGAPDADYIKEMTEWVQNGGQVTLDAFRELDADMKEGVLDYLADLPAYETVNAGGRDWLLVHSGVRGYKAGRDLDDYDPEDFCADDADRKVEGMTVICGHLPTTEHFDGMGEIYEGDGYYAIDCGAGRGGRLGCLCLDNGAKYYV